MAVEKLNLCTRQKVDVGVNVCWQAYRWIVYWVKASREANPKNRQMAMVAGRPMYLKLCLAGECLPRLFFYQNSMTMNHNEP